MTVSTLTPYGDLMTLPEVCALLKETGHPYSESTVRRWIKRDELPVERSGRTAYVSFSDILMAHQEAVLQKSC
ncbi:helix-turn-helix domain-containing protein [Streptomyces sp. NPDC047985]|uniref:helix-turn-helix domain-containing protein n=1 Tax=Streptomyces sp. NPDC047985 TaxID=3155384 RepID=UPI0034152AAD